MSKNLQLRFAIGSATGVQSDIWRVFSSRDEVYVAHRSNAHIEKLSFHSSGICRKAFTDEFGTPSGVDDRATQKWRRNKTPDCGLGKGSRVLTVGFPTDYLSAPSKLPSKPITWIAAAPPGMATVVEMFFTNETAETIENMFNEVGVRRLIASHELSTGELFVIASHNSEWDNKDIRMPSSHHEEADLIFSQHDPDNTGRPIRLSIYNNPKDGDAVIIRELGGYRLDGGSTEEVPPMDTFRRSKVLASSRDGKPAK